MSDLLGRIRDALAARYTIDREVGRGGMAVVFLALDLRHKRKVAIKVLHPDLAASVGHARFLREIEILARLNHPNILSLIDSGEADGLLYYVMPFVEGDSLDDRLARESQLPIEDAVQITREVADALGYAHSQNVVHRDIKPANIMFLAGHAVVTDFGIAQAVTEAGGEQLTQAGLSVGTPSYMSPEQATGVETVDARSDLYSLGCVLYEMVGGEPPYTGPTSHAILARHSQAEIPSVEIIRPQTPPYVTAVIEKALAKTPADRFASASAFASALTGPSISASGSGHLSAELATLLRRPKAGILAAIAVITGVWWGQQRTTPNANEGGPDPRRVAVLYFRTTGGDSLRAIAEGLTEGLIRELSRVSTLHVISPSGVLQFQGGGASSDSIGRALGAGSLVEGTVAEAGSRLRVSVSLVDAEPRTVLASATIERPMGDVFALQDSVTQSVAMFLRARLGEQVQLREDRRRASNAQAWLHVQEARTAERAFDSLVAAGDTTLARQELARADTLLDQAAALDPKWATPLSERGWLAWRSRYLVGGLLDPAWTDQWTTRALQHAEAALTVAPHDPDALTLRGTSLYFRHIMNLGADPRALGDSAEAVLRSATDADPNQAYAWSLLSHRLMRTSKTAEAKLAALRAYEADPYASDAETILWRLFSASLDLEDRVEASRWCNEGRHRFPEDPAFVECQITVQTLAGQSPDVQKMWRLLDESIQLCPPNQREFFRRRGELLVAMTLVRAGLPDSARSVALRARVDATVDPSRDLIYVEMLLRNLLGDREEALSLAAQYYAANPQDRVDCGSDDTENLDRTWWLRDLVDDPRYQALVCTGR